MPTASRGKTPGGVPLTSASDRRYVTPERVAKSKLLLSRLQKCYLSNQLDFICIDEVSPTQQNHRAHTHTARATPVLSVHEQAHCCAAQGHDFRPDYLSLGTLRASFPRVPILALTATASEQA